MRFASITTALLVITFPCYPEVASRSPKDLYSGQSQFALDLFLKISLEEKTSTENIFISPFGVYNALLLTYLFSGGRTKETMKDALHLPHDMKRKEVAEEYKRNKLMKTERYELLTADAIFVDNNIEIKNDAKKAYKDEIIRADFQSYEVVNAMNSWAANHTKNEITKIIDEPFGLDAKFSLANAVYFKGTWAHQFRKENSRVEDFLVSRTERVPVTMMKTVGYYPIGFITDRKASIVELPYDGGEVSMFGVLPNVYEKNHNVNDLLTRPILEEIFNKIRQSHFSSEKIDLSFPKFELQYKKELSRELMELGFHELFQGSPDLSKLTNTLITDVAVSHDTKVKVDERGTTAAAVTSVFALLQSAPHFLQLRFNEPFIYIIYNKVQETFLFMGIFKRPPA